MTPHQFQRASELFLEACGLEPDARVSFLDAECDDDELRAAVEAWLSEDTSPQAIDRWVDVLPRRIGHFEIIRSLGEGGMGTVYEAQQEEPRRRVALKVIRQGAVSRNLLRRFRHEVRVLGQLQHPGIAQIYEAGTVDEGEGGRPYFAMELVRGSSLREYADSHELGPREQLALIAKVCDALHHAHQKGVVHRDLKPGNILVEAERGQPKILDFGVARATDADVQTATLQTDMGQLVGTVPYMSPEQAAGDPSAIDICSDVYSIGVVAFELLTGRLPYPLRGKMIHEAVRIIRDVEPSRLSSVDKVLRGDVETIVAKTLEKDRARRYQSAAELAADIRRYLQDQPIVARPASVVYQMRKFTRRNKAIVAGLGIAFATMFVAMVVSLSLMRVANERADELEEAARRAYASNITSAASALALGDIRAAAGFLDVASNDRRGWEHSYLTARLDDCIAVIECESPVHAAAFAPGGEVITVTTQGALQRWTVDAATVVDTVSLGASGIGLAAISGDGRRVVAVIGGHESDSIAVWDSVTGGRLATLPVRGLAKAVAISTDGRRVIVCGPEAVLWEPDGGTEPRVLVNDERVHAAFSDDGSRLLLGSESRYGVYDASSGELLRRYAQDQIAAVGLSSRGERGAVASRDSGLMLIDLPLATRMVSRTSISELSTLAFDPRDRWIAGGAEDGTVRMWHPQTGESTGVLAGHGGSVESVVFDADDSRVLSVAGHTVRVYATDENDDTTVFRGHTSYVYGVGFVPDGRVVSGAWDNDIRFWQSETGRCLAVQPTERGAVFSLASRPDASMVATGHHHGRVHLRDAETGSHLRDLFIGGGQVLALDLSENGTRLAARSTTTVAVVDPSTGELVLRISETSPTARRGAVAISPDGSSVAYNVRGGFSVWDTDTGDEVQRTDDLGSHVLRLAYSPDGKRLAAGCQHGRVILVDTVTDVRQELTGHTANVYALAFSPHGRRLASGADDRTIRIWETLRGAHLLELTGHDDYVFDLAFSGDGRLLVSGSGDHTVRIWDTRPRHERWLARSGAAGSDSIPSDVPQCADAPVGVAGWWPGEGDGHDAVGEAHGSAVFGASYAVGFVGRAFALDGEDDHIVIPAPPARAQQDEAITLEAWIRCDSGQGGVIASRWDSSLGDKSWVLSLSDDGRLRWGIYNGPASQYRVVDTVDPVIRLRVFHHVAVSFDVGTQAMVVRVDGVEQPTTFTPPGRAGRPRHDDTVTTFLASSTVPMRIGAFIPGDGVARGLFKGLIDELTVYDRALTAEEIRAIHAADRAGKCVAGRD